MHKSKLSGFIIDCQTRDLEAAAAFWSATLGMEVQTLGPGEENYLQLLDRQHGLHIEVQRVTHPSRVHLDIETDDVDAEVSRLVGLGAKKVEKVRTWWVLEAPTGQRFCVVRNSTAGFDEKANVWE